ncbi:MAG: FAD-dependent oxidoreductase [Clostridiales bacterium]|nr:FAD-dependent oxidoreductase [Clostridiales bacterium]
MKKLLSLLLTLSLVLGLPAALANAAYPDGVHNGTAPGMMGNIEVAVTVNGGKIEKIDILSHSETPGLSDPAFEQVPAAMIEAQGWEVDAVGGATVTSDALVEAVKNALTGGGTEAVADIPFEQADVIVVGAGMAGLTSAVRAAELGLNVLLLEQQPSVGGSAMVAGGTLLGAGTRMQAEADIADSPELCFADFVRLGGAGTFNEEIAREFSEISGEAVDWLDDMGADFGDRKPYFGVYQPLNVARNYSGNGGAATFIKTLSEKLDNYLGKNAYLSLNTRVESLLTDGELKVVGVKATLADGTTAEYLAPATIICTGGYGGSESLLTEHNFDNVLSTSPRFVTGDGYRWLASLNAAFTNMDFCTSYAGGIRTHADDFFNFSYYNTTNGALWVDIHGQRMADETGADSKVKSDSWSNAEQNLVYTVFSKDMLIPDAKVFSSGPWGSIAEEFDPFMASLVEKGVGFEADTVEALAEKAGLPVDAFAATIQAYNDGCASGQDAFGRTKQLVAMDKGPFYAVKTMPYVMITSGGPMMTADCEVVNNDGLVIEGVYIAGEIVGMANVGGLNSIGGMGHGNCLTWGKQAAEVIAAKLGK